MSERTLREVLNSWVDRSEDAFPVTQSLRGLPGPPIWAKRTVREPVEPMHAAWVRLGSILNELSEDTDEAFYLPSPPHSALIELHEQMRQQAFRDAPNPEYDEGRAAVYWEQRENVLVGQRYAPPAEGVEQ